MLAYAVRLEMEERLAELLFVDDAPLAPADPAAPARRSQRAKAKAGTKRTQAGLAAHGFRDLLDALATAYNANGRRIDAVRARSSRTAEK